MIFWRFFASATSNADVGSFPHFPFVLISLFTPLSRSTFLPLSNLRINMAVGIIEALFIQLLLRHSTAFVFDKLILNVLNHSALALLQYVWEIGSGDDIDEDFHGD